MKPIAIVLGLGFGDEGKGSLVDWLVRRHAPNGEAVVVRHNGGAQAAHHVVTPAGRTHCFAQLGAGSLVPGTRTHLGAGMVIDPLALHLEAAALAQAGIPQALGRVTIDPGALVVTPWHALMNRLREALRGERRHGSTGRGIAEAELDAERGLPATRAGDAADRQRLRHALKQVRLTKIDQAEQLLGSSGHALLDQLVQTPVEPVAAALEALFEAGRARLTDRLGAASFMVLEGAQGLLLDRDHGFFPHVAPTRATRQAAEDALAALGLADHPREVWGVLRAYHTRHGDGPFPSADPTWLAQLPEQHNGDSPWQGPFRVGPFDAVLARYALARVGLIDRLALNAVDRIERVAPAQRLAGPALCDAWDLDGALLRDLPPHAGRDLTELAARARPRKVEVPAGTFVERVEAELGRRVDLVGRGPSADQKHLAVP